jgi:hypothetical protein
MIQRPRDVRGGAMKRSGAPKFPHSVQLFKFCQKVLVTTRGTKVHDQEVGSILGFNPSDCSHWKRGEKNVRSVFALAKLAEALAVEITLIHDVASGQVGLDEAFYEWFESNNVKQIIAKASEAGSDELVTARKKVEAFVAAIHKQVDFSTPPLYVPEVLRFFAFASTQPTDMMDKLSRILRVKPGQYCIQYRKGDLKPQTRMSMVKDLARIVFEGERKRFPEIGAADKATLAYEEMVFTAGLLAPKQLLLAEMAKLDSRRNVISELAALFWVPKSLVCFQLQDILRSGERTAIRSTGKAAEIRGAEVAN